MNLNDSHRTMVVDELAEVEKRMAEAKSAGDLLYFFSAAFGVMNRVMNFNCDPTLVFIHQVLQSLHQAVQARLAANTAMSGEHMATPDEFFVKMRGVVSALRNALRDDSQKDIYAALESAAMLMYATTGNGYYLYLTGKLKI